MEKYRNVLGQLCFTLKKFEVVRKPDYHGKYHIIENQPFYRTEAMINDGLWSYAPTFDSFIQAVKWLKENVNNLL